MFHRPIYVNKGGLLPFYDVIFDNDLQSANCQQILDAGDPLSYDGVSQNWVNRIAANGDHFRGTNGTVEGNPDGLFFDAGISSYFESLAVGNNGTRFRKQVVAEAWENTMHKDNALFSILAWMYPIDGNQNAMFECHFQGGGKNPPRRGTIFAFNTAPLRPSIGVSRNVAALFGALNVTSTLTCTASTWNCVGISLDEAAGPAGSHFYVNGSTQTFDGTYNTPTAVDVTTASEVYGWTSAAATAPIGARTAGVCAWTGSTLSTAQMDTFFNETRDRYGV